MNMLIKLKVFMETQGIHRGNYISNTVVVIKIRTLEHEANTIQLQSGILRVRTASTTHCTIMVYDMTDKESPNSVKNQVGKIDRYTAHEHLVDECDQVLEMVV